VGTSRSSSGQIYSPESPILFEEVIRPFIVQQSKMAGQSEIHAVVQTLLEGKLDVDGLDRLVAAAYDPVSPHRAEANSALMGLQDSTDLWQLADGIIEQSRNPQARFFGLQLLDDAIKTRYGMNK
jgi:hypothetical protein